MNDLKTCAEFISLLPHHPELFEKIRQILTPPVLYPEIKEETTENGHKRKNLGTYTCDMPRIRRFVAALRVHDINGWLYCFDFQSDTLRQIGGPNMELRCMDFEKVERIL